MKRKASQATLEAIRASGLVNPDFLRTYEEIYKHSNSEDGVTLSELDYILSTQKAHSHVNTLRQHGMVERIKRRSSKYNDNGSKSWAVFATDVVPTCRINWAAQKRPETESVNSEPVNGHTGTRKLWKTFTERILGHYTPMLSGVDPDTAKRVLQSLAEEIAALQTLIARRCAAVRLEAPNRHQLLRACELLNVAPPRAGRPIDLIMARKQMHTLARCYHPDGRVDSPRKDDLYRGVMEAFEMVERASQELNK